MKLGIVGLPNVGKSTLFNAITNAGAESANYPFCTIDPNVGMVTVPDSRLDKLAEIYHPKKTTPAVIEFVDIAGLVKGAPLFIVACILSQISTVRKIPGTLVFPGKKTAPSAAICQQNGAGFSILAVSFKWVPAHASSSTPLFIRYTRSA